MMADASRDEGHLRMWIEKPPATMSVHSATLRRQVH